MQKIKPLEKIPTPINEVRIESFEKNAFPFLKRKSDQKVFSQSVQAEDILTKEEVEKLKEDVKRKEESLRLKLEALKKEYNRYQAEMEINMLFKDQKILELQNELQKLKKENMNKEQTIIFQKELIKKKKEIIMEQTTEYMKHLNELAKEKKEESKEYAKLLARTVHDLKNPLTGIKSGLEVILEYDDLDEEKRQLVEIIYNSSKELSKMIEDILFNNKILHGAVTMNKKEVDLTKAAEEIVKMNSVYAKRTGKSIKIVNSEAVVAKVDGSLIKRALDNIIQNAIKYSKSKVAVSVNSKNNCTCIRIIDDGNGFDENVRKKIMSNKEMSTTDLINGNGFGLTNAKRIIEMHGGTISIISDKGNGTIFEITLPKNSEK